MNKRFFNPSKDPVETSRATLTPLVLLVIIQFFAGQWCIAQTSRDLPSNPMTGRIVFEEAGCIGCHSIDGYGGNVGPDLGQDQGFGSFFDLSTTLWNHAPKMALQLEAQDKKWPELSENEMDQLISYLFYLRYLGEPGNASIGKDLVESKTCLLCHQVGLEGAPDGIALDDLQHYASPLYIAQVIWNHGPEMQAKMVAMGVERPTFDDDDITHISAYLRAFSHGKTTKQQYMSPGNPKRGSDLFVKKGCKSCHAIEGEQMLSGTRLTEMNLHRSVTSIAGTMWNHGIIMWNAMQEDDMVWPQFEGSEMADLIAYLYFYDYQNAAGDLKSGMRVFQDNSCGNCHNSPKNPPFGKPMDITSPSALVQTMWNHVPYMRELTVTKNIDWPELTPEEFRNLYAYLFSLAPK